ncbi:MAG: DUF1778 domain-containing protein [Rhodanobacteraceae bacterium]|nr:DUF1778 domain-containing protein [Rhodanobacteraceae bacterium]
MSATQESARINLRTSPEAKALIERAAALMGTTVSSFCRTPLRRRVRSLPITTTWCSRPRPSMPSLLPLGTRRSPTRTCATARS